MKIVPLVVKNIKKLGFQNFFGIILNPAVLNSSSELLYVFLKPRKNCDTAHYFKFYK